MSLIVTLDSHSALVQFGKVLAGGKVIIDGTRRRGGQILLHLLLVLHEIHALLQRFFHDVRLHERETLASLASPTFWNISSALFIPS